MENDIRATRDNNGNLLTNNALTRALVYDTENRIQCVQGTDGTCSSSSATVYSYDPDGQRIAKATGAGTLIEEYVYDLKGDQASAHNSTSVLRNELYDPDGRHDATYSSSVLTYNFADWLGTERARFNSSGTESCLDMPYGMDLACSGLNPDPSPFHFTGKQRDTETAFDYFGARYFGSTMGRWLSPDWAAKPTAVPYADFGNPQSLNLYGYVDNNPLSRADADGHDFEKALADIKGALAQVTVTATIGFGWGLKGTGPAHKGRLELAAKANLKVKAGKASLSTSVEGGGTIGSDKKQKGLGGSIDKVVGSYDSNTHSFGGPEPPTHEWTVGGTSGGNQGQANTESLTYGTEGGEDAVGGGSISITKEGVSLLKDALTEVKDSLTIPPAPSPPAPPPPPQQPVCNGSSCSHN